MFDIEEHFYVLSVNPIEVESHAIADTHDTRNTVSEGNILP